MSAAAPNNPEQAPGPPTHFPNFWALPAEIQTEIFETAARDMRINHVVSIKKSSTYMHHIVAVQSVLQTRIGRGEADRNKINRMATLLALFAQGMTLKQVLPSFADDVFTIDHGLMREYQEIVGPDSDAESDTDSTADSVSTALVALLQQAETIRAVLLPARGGIFGGSTIVMKAFIDTCACEGPFPTSPAGRPLPRDLEHYDRDSRARSERINERHARRFLRGCFGAGKDPGFEVGVEWVGREEVRDWKGGEELTFPGYWTGEEELTFPKYRGGGGYTWALVDGMWEYYA